MVSIDITEVGLQIIRYWPTLTSMVDSATWALVTAASKAAAMAAIDTAGMHALGPHTNDDFVGNYEAVSLA